MRANQFASARILHQILRLPSEISAIRKQSDIFFSLSKRDVLEFGRTHDDFFILGSGESILGLSYKDWELIKNAHSIGINSWLFHSFTPDILAFEEVNRSELAPQCEAMSLGLERIAHSESRPQILKFRDNLESSNLPKVRVPVGLAESLRVYGRLQIPDLKNPSDLFRGIELALGVDKFGCLPNSVLIDHGASIVRMIHYAVRLGARRVILVGVDLVNSNYFFEVDSSYLKALGLKPFARSPKDKLHGTQIQRSGSGEITKFLGQLRSALLKSRGVELGALNPNSHLGSILPAIPR